MDFGTPPFDMEMGVPNAWTCDRVQFQVFQLVPKLRPVNSGRLPLSLVERSATCYCVGRLLKGTVSAVKEIARALDSAARNGAVRSYGARALSAA